MPNDYIDQIKLTNNTVVDIKDTVSGYITSADENVFVAIYGTTTASEVQAAINAGKLVMAMKSDGESIALLCGIASTVYSFSYSAPNATANTGYPWFSVWTLNRNTNSWNTVHSTYVAKRESPDLTGTPTAPTATSGTNTTQIATTAFVQNAINALDGGTIGTGSTTKTITSLSQTNGNVSATFSDIAFPVTSVNGNTGAVTTAEKFVITATAISGTDYYNLDKTFADINVAIGDNKYVTIEDIDMTYPYTTTTSQGIVFGATLIATGEGNQLLAITDGILVVPPDSGTNAMGIAVHSSTVLPTMSDIPSASSTTPSMDGTAAVGTGTTWARADHVHPTDTSRQAVLVSGTNIKTINNESLLGSGNITIQGGSTDCKVEVVEYGDSTYANVTTALATGKPVFCHVSWNNIVCSYIGVANNQYAFSNLGAGESTVSLLVNSSDTWSYSTTNLATQSAVNAKQDALVSGTNIKTINNESILGSGNISISGGTSSIILEGTYTTPSNLYVQKTPTELYNYLGAGTVVYIQGIYDDEDPYFRQRTNSLYRLNSVELQGEGNNSFYKASITSHLNVIGDNDTIIVYGYASGQTSDTSVAFTLMPIDTDSANATNSTSKLFLIGATSQVASPTTYSNSNVYETNGALNAKSFSVDASANIIYNSSSKSIDFTFV